MYILVAMKILVELESHVKDEIFCKNIWGIIMSALPVGQVSAKPKTLS